jgi:hypothetical protein
MRSQAVSKEYIMAIFLYLLAYSIWLSFRYIEFLQTSSRLTYHQVITSDSRKAEKKGNLDSIGHRSLHIRL